MNKAKEYTQDQIADAEKLFQMIQSLPEPNRSMYVVFMKVYMDGFEAGVALESNKQCR